MLCGFLQPSLIGTSVASGTALATTVGPSTQQCAGFLNAMTIGSAQYLIEDTIMRLEYIDYPAESYEIVKKYM